VWISLTGLAAVAIPSLYIWCKGDSFHDLLGHPRTLASFLDAETLARLGQEYLKRFPNENGKDILYKKLLEGKTLQKEALGSHLQQMVKKDYCTEQLVQLDGWILSWTEARQCALLNLSQPKPQGNAH
jgi:hypothetical protein